MIVIMVYLLMSLFDGSDSGTQNTHTAIGNTTSYYDDWQNQDNKQEFHKNETYYNEEYFLGYPFE